MKRISKLHTGLKLTLQLRLLFFIITTTFCLCFLNSILSAQEIKIMSYNIYHGEQHYVPGKSNLVQVAEIINKYNPDFVALQEVDSMTDRSAWLHNGVPKELVMELAALTGMYGFFGKAIDYSNGGYGEGILSRFPVKSTNYNLPIPAGGEIRALLLVNYTFPNGQEIIFAGTHLCHQFNENRVAQAKAICDIFKNNTTPIIMGGDFNFLPDSEPYNIITSRFKDAAVVKGNPKFTYPFDKPDRRLDYVFLSSSDKWIIKEVEVIPVSPSDHMPVLVTLELKNK